MSQPPMEPGYFTHLLNSNPQQYSYSLNQSNMSTPAAEAAYEAKRKKELGMLECRELEFLMLDPSTLPPEKQAIIERKQAEIRRKCPNA
ncbi:hypothetical protein Tco_0764818 [Tanacetum coccineum]